ncbi:MAG: T9SS type A sorting domain-containing protein [Chitinophagaceae bacterium]
MKTLLPALLLMVLCSINAHTQIVTPVINAGFGVDGELRSNYKGTAMALNTDDWFTAASTMGNGKSVIDTTGAAAIMARYATDMNFRRLPFFRPMRVAPFTVVNNRVWIDAVFIRDYHDSDSTVFASGGNKNGDSPGNWNSPLAQSIPDKNDILDMMVHIRREGTLPTDSLWMFGGVSMDNNTGNRYFDFEMYQTDILFDRNTRKFSGYGPDAGHTSWQFDAAGNVITTGDIIFSAEYQNSALTMIDARVWVNRAALSITPAAFDWSGTFDGISMGSTYGYAGIRPKQEGTYFTGLANSAGVWGGPFGIILRDQSFVTTYAVNQYVEFSVNLSKLGLDGSGMLGGNQCAMPFRRILTKTRSSSSFTSELKDFIGPFDFFLASRADVTSQTPLLCEGSVAELSVTNPVDGSIYEWSTANGNFVTPTNATSVYVDQPGTYIVKQTLHDGCAPYATDTINIVPMTGCTVLSANELYDLKGSLTGTTASLHWKVRNNSFAQRFEIERSSDGKSFTVAGRMDMVPSASLSGSYSFNETLINNSSAAYYRIVLVNKDGSRQVSPAIQLSTSSSERLTIYPNPATEWLQMQLTVARTSAAKIRIYTADGILVHSTQFNLQKGYNQLKLQGLQGKPAGTYLVMVQTDDEVFSRKFVLRQ